MKYIKNYFINDYNSSKSAMDWATEGRITGWKFNLYYGAGALLMLPFIGIGLGWYLYQLKLHDKWMKEFEQESL